MARAQTYIIDNENGVYSYLSEFHHDNHKDYIQDSYISVKENGYIPFYLMKQEICVIDIESHSKIGCIYLPMNLTDFQKKWILDRENYFKKIDWQLSKQENDIREIYNNIDFSKIKTKVLK